MGNDAILPPGTVVAGKYRIERLLGRGGMGYVVEASHLVLQERVALKFLLPQLAVVPDAVERFLREARAVIRIKSEHVARVMDVGALDTGEPFLVMEYLEGTDLLHALKKEGPAPIGDAIDWIIQASDALAAAHDLGIVHRDIKPSNLFRSAGTDGTALVKVLDFGISKVVGSKGVDALTRTQTTMGSAHYMSPEQMQSMRNVDPRSDVYSLGVTLYTLLAGKPPYDGSSVPAVWASILTGVQPSLRSSRPDVPEPLARAILKAFERDPVQRYGSVADFVFALSPWAPPHVRPIVDRMARMLALPRSAAAPPPAAAEPFALPRALPAGQWVAEAPAGGSFELPGSKPPPLTKTDLDATRVLAPTAARPAKRKSGGGGAVVAVFLGILVIGGGALALGWSRLRAAASMPNATTPLDAGVAATAPAAELPAAPTGEEPDAAAPGPSAEPTPSPSGEPTAAPIATPRLSGRLPRPSATPTAAPAPPPAKTVNPFDVR